MLRIIYLTIYEINIYIYIYIYIYIKHLWEYDKLHEKQTSVKYNYKFTIKILFMI